MWTPEENITWLLCYLRLENWRIVKDPTVINSSTQFKWLDQNRRISLSLSIIIC